MTSAEANVPGRTDRRSAIALSASAVLQIVLLAGVFVLSFFGETDPDLWWHLGTGRFILETGTLPQTDPFSYTAVGTQWIIPEWLGEVTIYALYAAGGYVLAVAFFGLAVTICCWLILRTVRMLGLSPVGATLVTAVSAALSWPYWMVRPHIISFLFFAIYLYLLVRSRSRRDRWLWLLPAVMVIWVNFHSGYVMGFLLLGLFLTGEYVNRAWGSKALGLTTAIVNPLVSLLRRYLPVVAATLLGAAVNPEGPRMLIYPITYVGSRNFNLNYVTEWSSPNFHEPYLVVFALTLLFLMFTSTRGTADWALALPMVAVTWMSLEWVRSIPFYAIAFGPYLATRLVNSNTRAGDKPRPHTSANTWNWLVLVFAIGIMASMLFLTDRAQLGREPKVDGFPVEGVKYIKDSRLSSPLFNTYHWGGFVLWSFYPERRVFIDGRTDMYGGEIFRDYREIANVGPRWKEVLDRYGIGVMLIGKESALRTLLLTSGDWREVFAGKVESVLVRR